MELFSWLLRALGLAFIAWVTLAVTQHLIKQLKRRGKRVPQPPTHWLFGNIPTLAEWLKKGLPIDQLLLNYIPRFGRIYQLTLLNGQFMIVLDPEATKEILVTHNYPKSWTYAKIHPIMGPRTLLSAPLHEWQRLRRAFNPGFALTFLKTLVPVFVKHGKVLIGELDKAASSGEVVRLHRKITLATYDIILETVASAEFHCQTAAVPPLVLSSFMELYDLVGYYQANPHLEWMRWLPWTQWKIARLQRKFDAPLLKIIHDRIAQMKATGTLKPAPGAETAGAAPAAKDILTLAIQTIAAESDGPLPIEDILSQIKTFLFAGHDTTAATIAFTIYELTRNPSIVDKLVAEIRQRLGDADPTADVLNQMPYLSAVVKETLRYWPAASTARIAPIGTTLQGYDAGGKVMRIPHYPLMHNPEVFGPDAGVFRPERWLDEAYVAGLHPYAYQPFSKGPRDCIGQVFALLEAKALVAMLVRRYTFTHAGNQPEMMATKITAYPKYGVQVRLALRPDA